MFREFKNLDKIFIYILHLIFVEENGTIYVCVCMVFLSVWLFLLSKSYLFPGCCFPSPLARVGLF